jgi:hypothetical protein
MFRPTISSALLIVAGGLSLAACTPQKAAETPPAKGEPAVSAAPTLPVSINATMVALVDHASEPLWVAAYKPPKTEAAWRETEYNAYQVAVTGKLIQLAGTGPNDAKWIADPNWKSDADAMSEAGMQALRAAQAKDVKSLDDAGAKLVEACEACHMKFKPSLTTEGLYKSPDYPSKK